MSYSDDEPGIHAHWCSSSTSIVRVTNCLLIEVLLQKVKPIYLSHYQAKDLWLPWSLIIYNNFYVKWT